MSRESAPAATPAEGTADSESTCVRVVIADDSETFRKAIRAYLSQWKQLEVVGCAATGVEAVPLVESTRPELVLMDLVMPQMDGLAATRELRRRGIGAKVMMISMHEDSGLGGHALAAGANAFVAKSDLHEQFEAHVLKWFGISCSEIAPE